MCDSERVNSWSQVTQVGKDSWNLNPRSRTRDSGQRRCCAHFGPAGCPPSPTAAASFLLGALKKRIVARQVSCMTWQWEGQSCARSPSRAVSIHRSRWRVIRVGGGFKATLCGPEWGRGPAAVAFTSHDMKQSPHLQMGPGHRERPGKEPAGGEALRRDRAERHA